MSLAALVRAARRRNDTGAFEDLGALLRREYDADAVLLTGSGTEALQLAIRVAAQRTGRAAVFGTDGVTAPRTVDAVTQHRPGVAPRLALPAFTCFDVATAAIWNELPLLFYDIDPDTLVPEMESLEQALDDGARIVVVNALYGVPVPWEPLEGLARRHGAVLIEDAAQGHGARWRGRRPGSFGEIGVLSFGRGKGWTGGSGGALLLRGTRAAHDYEVAARAIGPPRGSALLATAAQWALGRPGIYGLPASLPWLGLGETRYHEPVAPAAMPASSAVLALASHSAAEREAIERRRRALDLIDRIDPRVARVVGVDLDAGAQAPEAAGTATPHTRPQADSEPGFLRLPVRVSDAPRAVAALRRWGVAPSYPVSIAELGPVRTRLAGPPRRWPGAETLVRELVTLPTHGGVSERDIEGILQGFSKL